MVTITLLTPSSSTIFAMSGTPTAPTASWPPVIATVPLWSSLYVMSTPDATAARIASEPEWKNVPSPRFWTRCLRSRNGAMPIHCAPSLPMHVRPTRSPTRSASISPTMAWQPMPPPTSVPGSTRVLVLCGHPLQKNGARSTDRAISERPPAGAGNGARRSSRRAARRAPQRLDESLGVEDATGGDQRPALVVAPTDDSRTLVPVVERVADEPLERRVLLLDHDDLGEVVGELAHLRRLERDGHQQLEQADAGGAERVVVGESEQLQGLAHLVVRRAAGGDADPVVVAADRDPVEAVEHAVLAGQLGTHLEELALHVERVGRHQPTVRMRHERLAVEDRRRDLGHDPVGVDVDGSGAVGHLADELEAGPQSAGA